MKNEFGTYVEDTEYHYSDFCKDIRKNTLQRWELEAKYVENRDTMLYCCLNCGNSMNASIPIPGSTRSTPRCPVCQERMEVTGDDVLHGRVSYITMKEKP